MNSTKGSGNVPAKTLLVGLAGLLAVCVFFSGLGVAGAASTDTPKMYWGIFGELAFTTMTPTMVGVSTGPVSNVVLKSATTPDCYKLEITPNGSIMTAWVPCPK